MTLSGSSSSTTSTTGGAYSFTVASGGSYTVTPSLGGYTFSPISANVNGISSNQTFGFSGSASASQHLSFFTGETVLAGGQYYLVFPNGNVFGYYSYKSSSPTDAWILHADLGYEHIIPANDGQGGIYMEDLATNLRFYTSPTLFPKLYSYTMNAWLQYTPGTSPGHYSSAPRSFRDLAIVGDPIIYVDFPAVRTKSEFFIFDKGTGYIEVRGYTIIDDLEEYEYSSPSASISTTIGPYTRYGTETDNVYFGWAELRLESDVYSLGTTYTENSRHEASIWDDDPQVHVSYTGDISVVPGVPAITLSSIDATDPTSVKFGYSLSSGTSPFSVTLQMSNQTTIASWDQLPLKLSQVNFPIGTFPAVLTVSMYGIQAEVSSATCSITRETSISLSDGDESWKQYVGDVEHPGGAQYILVKHIGGYRVGTVRYCQTPVTGSYLTELQYAAGSIDTAENNHFVVDTSIYTIGESNNLGYGFFIDQLGEPTGSTLPAQSQFFQVRDKTYSNRWLVPQVPAMICNNILSLDAGGVGITISPMGCVSLTLP